MVNIYIATDHKSPRRRNARGLFVIEEIEEIREGQVIKTQTNGVLFQDTTANGAELGTIIMALQQLRRKDELHVYTESSYVAAGFSQGWIDKWRKNDWKNAKGEDVANKELWIRLLEQIEIHLYTIHYNEEHAYRDWMRHELKGRHEKSNGGKGSR